MEDLVYWIPYVKEGNFCGSTGILTGVRLDRKQLNIKEVEC